MIQRTPYGTATAHRGAMGAAIRLIPLLCAVCALPAAAQIPSSPPNLCTAPEHRQFDFWVGFWDVYKTGTNELVARSRVERVYGDCVLREDFKAISRRSGGSLTSYDPEDGAWHMYWTDVHNARVAFKGGMVDGAMVLRGEWRNYAGPGQHRLAKMVYYPGERDTLRQRGELSSDGGQSWTVEFDFTYRPQELVP